MENLIEKVASAHQEKQIRSIGRVSVERHAGQQRRTDRIEKPGQKGREIVV